MTSIQELWEARKTLLFNGIVHKNGSAIEILVGNAAEGQRIKPGARTSVFDLQQTGCQLVEIEPLASAQQSGSNHRVVCGDGAFGADGFVCLMNDATVMWLAFFDSSNPFVSAELDGGLIVAKNNINELWKFPIDSPESIAIEAQ